MMECLIKMLREFSMRNMVHGDIQPCNIFVYEENNQKNLIIIDSCFLGDTDMGYYRMMNDPDFKTPLSGSALHCLMDRDMNASFNRQKNDLYAAAITL